MRAVYGANASPFVRNRKKVLHRSWAAFQARLAFTLAAFNLLVRWQGLVPDAPGLIRLSIAEFSL